MQSDEHSQRYAVYHASSGKTYYVPSRARGALNRMIESNIISLGCVELMHAWDALHASLCASDHRDIAMRLSDFIAPIIIQRKTMLICEQLLATLLDATLDDIVSFVMSQRHTPVSDVSVPASLRDAIHVRATRATHGMEVGSGEMLVPLLFADACWNSNNSLHDVTIMNEQWHVKYLHDESSTAPMGKRSYPDSDLARELMSIGMLCESLTINGHARQSYAHNWRSIGALMGIDPHASRIEHAEAFQARLDTEFRINGIGEQAAGIIFIIGSERIRFVRRDQCHCAGVSQGTFIATLRSNKFVRWIEREHAAAYSAQLLSAVRQLKRIMASDAQSRLHAAETIASCASIHNISAHDLLEATMTTRCSKHVRECIQRTRQA